MKTIILSILAGLFCNASARIGETRDQLVARYGIAKYDSKPEYLNFRKNGIYVSARMWNGVCHCIQFTTKRPYVKADDGAFGGGFVLPSDTISPPPKPKIPAAEVDNSPDLEPLNDLQVKQLLDANCGTSKWIEKDKGGWMTEDGSRFAFFSEGELVIKTAELSRHDQEEEKKSATEKTDGF